LFSSSHAVSNPASTMGRRRVTIVVVAILSMVALSVSGVLVSPAATAGRVTGFDEQQQKRVMMLPSCFHNHLSNELS
jgi:hypothetical protein